MESNNQLALAVIDRQFQILSDRIDVLDQLSDRLQASKERLAELDGEISQVKSDVDGLGSKRASRLTALNSSKEIAQADDSAIVAKIVTAKSNVIAVGRGVRQLISTVIFQVLQAQKMRYMVLLDEQFSLRKIPIRASDLASAGRDVVRLKEMEELLTRPLRGQDQELGALYSLKVHFEKHVRTAIMAETNLVLDLPQAAEEPVPELVEA